MLRNKISRSSNVPVIKLFSLSAAFLLQTACGGGDTPDAGVQHQDLPIAYVKRPIPRDNNGDIIQDDLREPSQFNPGGDLFFRARASATAQEINITGSLTQGLGDVKDVAVNYEGTKLIFSLRLEDDNMGDDETWDLYEYDVASGVLSRVFSQAIASEGHDISPTYLPDGRIAFSSTRQELNKGLLLDENKPQYAGLDERRRDPAFTLHVINFDETVKQISFNQSHDLDPIVLENSGRILFSRWNNMGNQSEISLYSMTPDGRDVQMHYGSHSHNTGTNNSTIHFSQPRETTDNQILSIVRPFTGTLSGGDIIKINTKDYADNTQAIWSKQTYLTGPAQTVLTRNVSSGNTLSRGGRFSSVYPIGDGDGRALVSWAPCLVHEVPADPNSIVKACNLVSSSVLSDPDVIEAAPSYGIYLMDFNNYTQIPILIAKSNTIFSDVVTVYPRNTPTLLIDKTTADPEIDSVDASHKVGVLHIRSVYDFDGTFNKLGSNAAVTSSAEMADPTKTLRADNRPARFIRFIKAVSIPDDTVRDFNNSAYGVSANNGNGMREILGYAAIEPDGSVKVKIPANVPFTFSILDKEGRRIQGLEQDNTRNNQRHRYWMQVKPGETLECVGCHNSHANTPENSKPHGRTLNQPIENTGQTDANKGLAFPHSMSNLWAEKDETMAEAKARHSCSNSSDPLDPCPEMKLDVDLVYNDVWTDPNDVANMALMPARIQDLSYVRRYSALTTAKPYTSPNNCKDTLDATRKLDDNYRLCRVVINYETHIEPLWTTTTNRPNGSCVSCHNQASNIALSPAGQLNLVSQTKTNATRTDQLNSFNELLRATPKYLTGGAVEQEQDVINGVPQFELDVNGDPTTIPIMVDVLYPATMSLDGARASYFIEKMTGTELDAGKAIVPGPFDHSVMMSPDELKLISEWIDIGAQYFNNPFDAPTNN